VRTRIFHLDCHSNMPLQVWENEGVDFVVLRPW
jgi:hypothetical protein